MESLDGGRPLTTFRRRHPRAKCEECPLYHPDNTFVPSNIPTSPRIIMVGEAPGFQEAQRKLPFVGASGKLLNTVLKSYKFRPSEVGYTNACLCRPPGNSTPPKAAVVACSQRLYHELEQSGARDVVALGGTAASILVDDNRTITHLRVGPPKAPARALDGSSVERIVPTWHPAYCLRTADAFPALVTDIGKLFSTRTEKWRPPEHHVIDDPETAIAWLNSFEGIWPEHTVVDIEVGIEKDVSFGHPNTFDMLCVGLQYQKGVAYVLGENALRPKNKIAILPDDPRLRAMVEQGVAEPTLYKEEYDLGLARRVWEALQRFLQRTKIIAHNGKFDLAGLFPHVGALELWFDTMLAHYALDERVGAQLHGLKVLSVELLGAPQYDLDISTYVPRGGSYANIPRPILYKYNAYDVSCTWDLFELFSNKMDQDDVRRVHDFMVRASNQLMFLELNGITFDRAYSDQLEADYSARLYEIESSLSRLVHAPVNTEDPDLTPPGVFNPRSPKQIREFLESHGLRTASTDASHLEEFQLRTDPGSRIGQFVAGLLQYRREHKLYSTYVEGLRRRLYRGRVYTTYLLHGTTSGRLASRNPNLQNVVRDKAIRRQFSVSNPDNVLIQADYQQAEGRVIATLAQDEYLRTIFSNPEINMFDELSDQLYGRGKWGKEERIRTKAFFYGLSYGRGAQSIGMEYGMSNVEAQRRLDEFMSLIPATAAWQKRTKEMVLGGGDLVTPFGRKRRFHLITDQNQRDVLNEALSFLPQSTASDICLSALIRLRPMLRGLGWIRLTIHDALVVECPERNSDQVQAMLRQVMLEEGKAFTDYVPFSVDVSIGKSWGDL